MVQSTALQGALVYIGSPKGCLQAAQAGQAHAWCGNGCIHDSTGGPQKSIDDLGEDGAWPIAALGEWARVGFSELLSQPQNSIVRIILNYTQPLVTNPFFRNAGETSHTPKKDSMYAYNFVLFEPPKKRFALHMCGLAPVNRFTFMSHTYTHTPPPFNSIQINRLFGIKYEADIYHPAYLPRNYIQSRRTWSTHFTKGEQFVTTTRGGSRFALRWLWSPSCMTDSSSPD